MLIWGVVIQNLVEISESVNSEPLNKEVRRLKWLLKTKYQFDLDTRKDEGEFAPALLSEAESVPSPYADQPMFAEEDAVLTSKLGCPFIVARKLPKITIQSEEKVGAPKPNPNAFGLPIQGNDSKLDGIVADFEDSDDEDAPQRRSKASATQVQTKATLKPMKERALPVEMSEQEELETAVRQLQELLESTRLR